MQMLQVELQDEPVRWACFNEDASGVVRLTQSEAFCSRIVAKVDDLNRRWRQFEQSLATRLTALTEARKEVFLIFWGIFFQFLYL
jgi:hypothetical protein